MLCGGSCGYCRNPSCTVESASHSGYFPQIIEFLLRDERRDISLHQFDVLLALGQVGLDVIEGQLLLI